MKGQVVDRTARTNVDFDHATGEENIKEISNYCNAWPMRRVAEDFIVNKIAPELR